MSPVCGGLPCLWISTLRFFCFFFKSFVQLPEFNTCSDWILSWETQINRDSFRWVWAEGLQLKTAVKNSINVYSLGLCGPTVESVPWVCGWCEGDVCFSSSRWRLGTQVTIWAPWEKKNDLSKLMWLKGKTVKTMTGSQSQIYIMCVCVCGCVCGCNCVLACVSLCLFCFFVFFERRFKFYKFSWTCTCQRDYY